MRTGWDRVRISQEVSFMIFDTHAHYDSGAFNADREELLRTVHQQGVGLIVDPGCELESSRMAIRLAEHFPYIYAAVGFHPEDMDKFSADAYREVVELALHPRCVAIGEVGLDYYWDAEHKEEQKELFRGQVELAIALDKPLIVHDREAHADCLEIVRDYPNARGVFHCYSGSAEMAQELLKRGWYLGFDGPITYKNARKALEVLEICPLNRIVIETDSPYLSPVPLRGSRNDSRNLRYVIDTIAGIKDRTPEEIEEITWDNGRRLFNV